MYKIGYSAAVDMLLAVAFTGPMLDAG